MPARTARFIMSTWFQSAPLTEARGDMDPRESLPMNQQKFQSAPLTEARGDMNEVHGRVDAKVFQSAPLTEARGDCLSSRMCLDCYLVFQSAPLTEARGDRQTLATDADLCQVSIRSPDRSQGRWSPTWGESDCSLFQSAPLTEARGDAIS